MTSTADRTSSESGYGLLSAVVMTAVLLVSGVAAVQMARSELHATADHVVNQKAFYVAETGVEYALAQLKNDAATANSSTTYTYSTPSAQSFGEGSFQVTIAQDLNHATDPRWKRIVSTGAVHNGSAVIAAQAFVQPSGAFCPTCTPPTCPTCSPPCPTCSPSIGPDVCNNLLASNAGRARLFGVAAVGVPLALTTLFSNGDIFTNPGNDVYFSMLASLNVDATGTVYAGRDFHTSNLVGLASKLHASLLRGGSYVLDLPETALTHLHLFGGPSVQGFHFNNANNNAAGHGVASTIAPRRLPRPDYESLKRQQNTVIVNAANVPAGTSWNSSTNTWVVAGPLIFGSFSLNPNVNYYVEGNAQISSLQLAANSSVQIVARGSMAVQSLELLTLAGLCTSGTRLIGPVSAGASVCATVGPGTVQKLHLYAERDLVIGYSTVDITANVFSSAKFLNATEQTYLQAGIAAGVGLGATVANIGGSTNLLARSEKGSVWALVSAVGVNNPTNVNICAEKEATLVFGVAAVGSSVGMYTPS